MNNSFVSAIAELPADCAERHRRDPGIGGPVSRAVVASSWLALDLESTLPGASGAARLRIERAIDSLDQLVHALAPLSPQLLD